MNQDWDEIEALRASLREHMAEIKRLNECLTWEQHRAGHVGTHGPGCAMWGPKHYECLLQAHEALKALLEALQKRTSQESRQVEPVAYVTGYFDGKCVISPVEHVVFPNGMALYRSPPKREPMTDETLWKMWVDSPSDVLRFARAIERAHGIGGEE